MIAAETLMFSEAAEAAEAAERQAADLADPIRLLGARLRELDPRLVITCARGSSDHAATFAKYLIETRARIPVASFAPSTSSVYGTAWRTLENTLFLAISQSGRSPDLLASARAAREAGALVVAIVNEADTPLADLSDVVLPMLAGPERSVAATKSFIASLLIIARIVATWTDDEELHAALADVADVLRRAWSLDWSPAVPALVQGTSLYILGRGLSLAIAQEAALKLKETCGLHAEPFSAAEVRHGPMAIVKRGFPVFLLPPADEGQDAFNALAEEFCSRGAKVIQAGTSLLGSYCLPTLPDLHPVLAPIALIQTFYRLAIDLSLARGLDPDQPSYLRKVTETR